MRILSHILSKTIISKSGFYRTRGGEIVHIKSVDKFAHGEYPGGIKESWDISGRIYPDTESKNDIVELVYDEKSHS